MARKPIRQGIALAAGLVAYGNLSAFLTGYLGLSLPGGMLVPNLVGVALLLRWATRRGGLSPDDLGVRREGAFRGAAWGALAGVLMAIPALAVFTFPPLLEKPISYRPIAALDAPRFLKKILLDMPVATALCEELAFRGVLQGLLARALSTAAAVLAANAAFALWHVVITLRTASESSVAAARLVPIALLSGLVGVFGGGVIFSLLRLRTGRLAGSVIAHWMVDALMTVAVYARR